MDKEYITKEGIISKKEKNISENPKAPIGFIYLENFGEKLAVWKKHLFDKIIENGEYKLQISIKENEYNGKKYVNYSVEEVIDKTIEFNMDKTTFNEEQIKKLEDKGISTEDLPKGEGETSWIFMGYPIIIDNDVEEIRVPEKIKNYLIQLNFMEYTETDE